MAKDTIFFMTPFVLLIVNNVLYLTLFFNPVFKYVSNPNKKMHPYCNIINFKVSITRVQLIIAP
jgi:hypothetical protein